MSLGAFMSFLAEFRRKLWIISDVKLRMDERLRKCYDRIPLEQLMRPDLLQRGRG